MKSIWNQYARHNSIFCQYWHDAIILQNSIFPHLKHSKATFKRYDTIHFDLVTLVLSHLILRKCFAVGLVIPCLYKTIKSCVFSAECYLSLFSSISILCTAAQICTNNVFVVNFHSFVFFYIFTASMFETHIQKAICVL